MAQQVPNYEESKVPAWVLPDIFLSGKGKWIRTQEDGESIRRPEVLRLFESEVYSKTPKNFDSMEFDLTLEAPNP